MVRCIYWISRVTGIGTIQRMMPLGGDLSTSCNGNNLLRNWLMVGINSTVANDIVRVDVHYGLKISTLSI